MKFHLRLNKKYFYKQMLILDIKKIFLLINRERLTEKYEKYPTFTKKNIFCRKFNQNILATEKIF